MSRYSLAQDPPRGALAERVVSILEMLADAGEDGPLEFDAICDELDVTNPASRSALLPAMYALEFVGAVDRYTYLGASGTRAKLAFQLSDAVEELYIGEHDEEDQDV